MLGYVSIFLENTEILMPKRSCIHQECNYSQALEPLRSLQNADVSQHGILFSKLEKNAEKLPK